MDVLRRGAADQFYEYTPDPNGRTETYRRKLTDGSHRWEGCYLNDETGRWNKGRPS